MGEFSSASDGALPEVASALPAAPVAGGEAQVLKACMDAMINPQVLMQAVRDPGGQVVDFLFRSANRATLSYLQLSEGQLIGGRALTILPRREEPGLLPRLAQCLADGEPVSIDDFPYFNEAVGEERRYDIRATRAGPDLLAMTWSDVTSVSNSWNGSQPRNGSIAGRWTMPPSACA